MSGWVGGWVGRWLGERWARRVRLCATNTIQLWDVLILAPLSFVTGGASTIIIVAFWM